MIRLALAIALSLAMILLTNDYRGCYRLLRFSIAAIMAVALVTLALAFDNGQWGSVDPATREWFRSLKSPGGGFCCDGADGVRIEDPAWKENKDHSYEVFARDKWNQIPPDRVLTGSNKVGYAILWWPPSQQSPTCFLPGSKG